MSFLLRTFKNTSKSTPRGFTLVEIIVTSALFGLIAVGFYQVYSSVLETTNLLRLKNMALFIANSQIELVRNANYDEVGLVSGLPNGIFEQFDEVEMNGVIFEVERIIRAIDEPFDGLIGGLPQDLSPADNKLVQVTVKCESCQNFSPVRLVARVAPKHLETSSSNGAMRITVFNSEGIPIQGARVQITNDDLSPPVSFVDTTNSAGELLIVDAPPGVETYKISVSKDGYSTEETFAAGEDGVLNPVKPNLTVAMGLVADASFSIDLLSSLSFMAVNTACSQLPNLGFRMYGSRLLSADPNLLKYDEYHQTSPVGLLSLENLEWDTYFIESSDETYTVVGMNPLSPLSVDPGQNGQVLLVGQVSQPNMLSITVLDDDSGLTISSASVTLSMSSSYEETLLTDVGVVSQTDWSGGFGQDEFVDNTRFLDQVNIDYLGAEGEVTLDSNAEGYFSSGYLTSSTFDVGDSGVIRTFDWAPLSQASPEQQLRFQLATNEDNNTWNFIGPDGTADSYYTSTNRILHESHAGDRYLRYRAYFDTTNPSFTPYLSDVYLTFTSGCVPPGQVTFSGLESGTYQLAVNKDGYTTFTSNVEVLDDWQSLVVRLLPN